MGIKQPPAQLPFADSLCHRCAALALVTAARSTFMRCTALAEKYPPQPVLRCAAFTAAAR